MVRPWMLNRAGLIGLVACLQALLPEAGGYFGLASTKDELITVALNQVDNYLPGRKQTSTEVMACDTLFTKETQAKMCKRQGISTVLIAAARLSVKQCQLQYRGSRWNCSTAAKHRINTLNGGFKETAFMYAISSAGLVDAFARACSMGQLDQCSCDDRYPPETNKQTWMWGGCGDNIIFARKFTKRFLRSRKSQDLRAQVDRHNTNVGIREVRKGVTRQCKCHGVSGSCIIKTCWRQLSKFEDIGKRLKNKARKADMVISVTNTAKGKNTLRVRQSRNKNSSSLKRPGKGSLTFTRHSPPYCDKSPYSYGVRGRLCSKESGHCGELCCGRGYDTLTRTVKKRCECKFIWCCNVTCEACQVHEEYYMCK